MKIQCNECGRSLGDITGKLRTNGGHAARFICAECLAKLRTARAQWAADLFDTLFSGGLRK